MDRYSIAPDSIEIEITEGVFLGAASDTVRRSIDELHMCNIPLALDDFGTGFASLSHLRSLPVSTLTIDRYFVSGVTARESAGRSAGRRVGKECVSTCRLRWEPNP